MSQHLDLVKQVADLLKKGHGRLVSAESCTGGLIASYLTELPGSSQWFERGFVTYSNLSKEEMLSVPKDLLSQYGAVSEEVAYHMALGALKHSQGSIALAVTGIAGPEGGSIEKPVGTVCFAWATSGGVPTTIRKQFQGSRQDIRIAAALEALRGLLIF